MFSGSPEVHQKTFQIKQDDKFFSRLLSKENSISNPSFRVYYGGVPSSVPFVWESQPGTPKHIFSENVLPPLTPPPSYYSNSTKKPLKKHGRSSNLLLKLLFPKPNLKKTIFTSSSSPSPLSNTSSLSPRIFPLARRNYKGERQSWGSGSSLDSKAHDDEEEEEYHKGTSPNSALCLGVGRKTGSGGFGRWCRR